MLLGDSDVSSTLQDYLTIQNSHFTDNLGRVRNGELKDGAVFNNGFNLKIINSTFLHNKDWYEMEFNMEELFMIVAEI